MITTFAQLSSRLTKLRDERTFRLSETSFKGQNDWFIKDGILRHKTGGFFQVIGYKNLTSNAEKLMLYQPQGALTGLTLHRTKTDIFILLQFRAEPGNVNIVQLGPTIQSTPANYMALHGGKFSSYADFFIGVEPFSQILNTSVQLDLGEYYCNKSKTLTYIEVDERLDEENDYSWVSLSALKQALPEDHVLNTDLRSLLGVFDWDGFSSGCLPHPNSNASELSEVMNALFKFRNREFNAWKFVPIENLAEWIPTNNGFEAQRATEASLKLYDTVCEGREVSSWTQPLMECASVGRSALYRRTRANQVEYLISVVREPGFSFGAAFGPSFQTYHDDIGAAVRLDNHHEVIVEVEQSDEGGRFLKQNVVYQVVNVPSDFEANCDQVWVSKQTFKNLLATSNMVNIQLRCLASLVVAELNPITFGNG